MIHHCHATNCLVKISPEQLLCKEHWQVLPWGIKKRIWDTYRHGQTDDMQPSREYLAAARSAVIFIAKEEGHKPNTRMYDQLMGEK